jgi:hypothetical protein
MATRRQRFSLLRLFTARKREGTGQIPREELERFLATMSAAEELAARGAYVDGYDVLAAGLRQAEGLRTIRQEPWGAELALHYRQALERYERRWSVCH